MTAEQKDDIFACLFFDCSDFRNVCATEMLMLLTSKPLSFVFSETVSELPPGLAVKHIVFFNSKDPPLTLAFVFAEIWRVQFLEYAFASPLARIDVVKVESGFLSVENCFLRSTCLGFFASQCSLEKTPSSRSLSDGIKFYEFAIR